MPEATKMDDDKPADRLEFNEKPTDLRNHS
jgi:hypothetical protein